MTTDISALLNEIADFIKFLKSIQATIEDILQKLEQNIYYVHGQVESYCVSKKAIVPPNILKNFPDVKERLLTNLNSLIDEEITEITTYINQLSSYSADLKTRCEKIEKMLMKINWKENLPYLNAFSRIYEWAENCWKYFHFIYFTVLNGILSLMNDEDHSSTHLKFIDTVDSVNKETIFNNTVIEMFELLKMDFATRNKVKNSLLSEDAS